MPIKKRKSDEELITHLPPIIIGSGSCWIESARTLGYSMVGTGLPHQYKCAMAEDGDKIKLSVLTEGRDVEFSSYTIDETECELQICLDKQDSFGKWNPVSSGAQITVKADKLSKKLEIKSDLAFAETDTHKFYRDKRHNHPGYGSAPFRIGEWKVVKGTEIVKDTSGKLCTQKGDESYIIIIEFEA